MVSTNHIQYFIDLYHPIQCIQGVNCYILENGFFTPYLEYRKSYTRSTLDPLKSDRSEVGAGLGCVKEKLRNRRNAGKGPVEMRFEFIVISFYQEGRHVVSS